jgi:hypothetical protein
MIDDDIVGIFERSVDVRKTAERLGQLTGRRFIVEEVEKNDGDGFTAAAYSDPEDPGDEADSPAERRARLRRELAAADERERRRNGAPKGKVLTVDDLTGIADTVCKRADAITVGKLAAAEVKAGVSLFTSYERSAMLTAIAKAQDRGGGSDDQKTSRFLQDPANLLYRQWALLRADATELAKRNNLLDDVAKTRAAGDGAGGSRALGGRVAFAVGAGSAGVKPTEADRLREQVIRDQKVARPWLTAAELEAYADSMVATVRSRPKAGTQDRI